MGRPQVHSDQTILDAARTLVLDHGVRAATVAAIAQASGAPKGSIYHRFASREDLLAEMWIRAVRRSQDRFIEAVSGPDPLEAAVAGALSLYDFAQREPGDARLLAAVRREDLVASVESAEIRHQLADLNIPLRDALRELTRRLYGKSTTAAVEQTTFAVVDLPLGGIRRHLIAASPLPRTMRDQLAAAVRAALQAEPQL
ncbi:MAG TPA: TetR/AcrR family transcriptional regulator [Acidimicrobiales bacterium]|jgi:AcrR family transcriptional regulator